MKQNHKMDKEDSLIEALKNGIEPCESEKLLIETLERFSKAKYYSTRLRKACPKLFHFINKEYPNISEESKFKHDLIQLIFRANNENLDKLDKAYPELVKKYGRRK